MSLYDGFDKQQGEPLLLILFPRQTSAADIWLFCYVLCWGFYGRKISVGEARTQSLGERSQDLAEGAAAGVRLTGAPQERVRRGSLSNPSPTQWVNWARWPQMSHQAAQQGLYPQALGNQEGLQAGA